MKLKGIFSLLVLISYFQLNAQVWTQMGGNINGETEIEASGRRVSMSANGETIAVAAQFNDDNGTDSGIVRVYSWSGSAWLQKGSSIEGEAEFDQSGESISLSDDGNTIAIGAPYNLVNGDVAGHTRIYLWNGSSWQQKGLDINAEGAQDRSGSSVSLSSDGNIVAIGAPYNDSTESDTGHVRVFEWNGSTWLQKGIDLDGLVESDRFGFDVKLDNTGNTLAVGNPTNSNVDFLSGTTRIYDWDGSNWIQRGNDINGQNFGSQSGYSISLNDDGNIIAIGDSGTDTTTRIVRMFFWNGTTWEQKGETIAGGGDSPSNRPVSLNANGNIVAIGTGGSGAFGGQVKVYEWSGSSWVQVGTEIECDSNTEDCRRAVVLNATGDILAIGDPSNNGGGNSLGQVRVFTTQTLGINDNIFASAKVYPNPTSGLIHLDLFNLQDVSVKVIDTSGRLIYSEDKISSYNPTIDLIAQQSGFYFIEIFSENKSRVYKVIKQ